MLFAEPSGERSAAQIKVFTDTWRIWGRVEDVPALRKRLEVVSDQLAKLMEFHKTDDTRVLD